MNEKVKRNQQGGVLCIPTERFERPVNVPSIVSSVDFWKVRQGQPLKNTFLEVNVNDASRGTLLCEEIYVKRSVLDHSIGLYSYIYFSTIRIESLFTKITISIF